MPDASGVPVVPKTEHSRESSPDSARSSAAAAADAAAAGVDGNRYNGGGGSELGHAREGGDIVTSPHPEAQVQKRKGGRKPIYATSEERKQRNRQAQAAFRERRTEYIKQLESTIKHHEETLQNLQQSHRSAADECLMLRYKNSLLERILLEKSVDVQAELKKKEISIPTKVPPSLPQPTPIQRAAMNRRHQYSRSASGSISLMNTSGSSMGLTSPPGVQSPTSQDTSPMSVQSPIYTSHVRTGSMGFKAPPPPLRINPSARVSSPGVTTPLQAIAPSPLSQPASAGIPRSNHWSSPYETHMQQLEQEYDAHADMIDDQDAEEPTSGPGPYPPGFPPPSQFAEAAASSGLSPVQDGGRQLLAMVPTTDGIAQLQQLAGFDPFDPLLDADPFGLTASMHFPTQFSFQESSMRK